MFLTWSCGIYHMMEDIHKGNHVFRSESGADEKMHLEKDSICLVENTPAGT